MEAVIQHLHTYFLFPFAVDRSEVLKNHGQVWHGRYWIDGLDDWINAHPVHDSPVVANIGRWQRASYTQFDLESPAYQDMIFFHPFVRRIFFDTAGVGSSDNEVEALLRCYSIPLSPENKLFFTAEDNREREAEMEVTDLRLFLFANGIGMLGIGVEAFDLPVDKALWINEMARKIYPSSGRQLREGRTPSKVSFSVETPYGRTQVLQASFEDSAMRGFLPPVSNLITSLLYFADYQRGEYEPVLDERTIVYSYLAVDPHSVPENFHKSEEYDILFSRALYVDHDGKDYRYARGFTKRLMEQQVYRRWAHQGTLYGFTSYSNVTMCFGTFDCDDHQLSEGFLIHRMFDSRYYLMAIIALFYRATLLDFAERVALVSRRLYVDFQDGRLSDGNIERTNQLRYEFLVFSNYWHFDELANKDEESEHFRMLSGVYDIHNMKMEVEREIDKLNSSLTEYYTARNTQAVNRLAFVSTILGAGAVVTGFFGMNFSYLFEKTFFHPTADTLWIHWAAILAVVAFCLFALGITAYLFTRNWADYRNVLRPGQELAPGVSRKPGVGNGRT
ncbi:CorA family divalent cation transporter [Bryobacter aggregatus]|uniref:CorA family divalent cation transporter n=1 Tax=Bryobacter aggregatus TaxID=360054 RepID=UPI0004E0F3EB|nr:CorA family divalent cation transporter [Bryobacter aggregatus]